MESSSYSKTRSPARFLAAFLAVAVLFIFMPVLPVGAAKPTTIVFKDVYDASTNEWQYADSADNLAFISELTGGQDTWGSISGNVDVSQKEESHQVTFSNATIPGKILSFIICDPLTFDPITDSVRVYYEVDGGEKTYASVSSEQFRIPVSSLNGSTLTIGMEKVHTVEFTGQTATGSRVYVGSDKINDGDTVKVQSDGNASLEFSVTVNSDKIMPTVSISKSDGTTSSATFQLNTSSGKTYNFTVSGINENIVIQLGTTERTVKLTFTKIGGDGWNSDIHALEADVPYDSNYTFNIGVKDGYDFPTVKKDGTDVSYVENGSTRMYTLRNLTNDTTITIGDAQKKTYKVTFPSANTYTITDKKQNSNLSENWDSVPHGTVVSFVLELNDGYKNSDVTVYANTQVLSPTEGNTYSFTVRDNTVIRVENVKPDTYTIGYTPMGTGWTVSVSATSATYNTTVTVTVSIQEGYEIKDGKTFSSFFQTISGSGTSWTNGNAKDGIATCTITVKGNVNLELDCEVGLKQFDVSDVSDDGSKKGYETNFEKKADWGSSYTFTVTVKPGYRLKGVTATSNEAACSITSAGKTYTIQNVRGPVAVTITTAPITFTVTYQAVGGRLGEDILTTAGVKKTYQYADAEAVTLASVETPHLCQDTVHDCYTLELETPTRKGFIITEWTVVSNGGGRIEHNEEGKFEIRNYGDDDVNVTVRGTWAVDVSVNHSEDNAFFKIVFSATHTDRNVDKMNATISTNLIVGDEDYNAGVSVKAYGIVYGNHDAVENVYNTCNAHTFDGGEYKKYVYFDSTKQALYVKMQSGEHGEDTSVKDGGVFTVSVGHSTKTKDNCTREAFAWVILTINGEECLFKSKIVKFGLGNA